MQAIRRETALGLTTAVHRNKAMSRAGLSERLFTFAFRGLVYPQIWEDPLVDMEALRIGPDDHVVAIASGGCNVLSYLAAGPARISAVDLNGAHVALGNLKRAALRHLPDHASFFRFFGQAVTAANIAAYRTFVRPHLDAMSRGYWDGRGPTGRRRIAAFADNFYRHGLLGRFIGWGHLIGRLHGCDPRRLLAAKDRDEQRRLYERHLAPIFDKPLLRWLVRRPASLYGLGIPPAQYRSLSRDSPDGIAAVLKQRLERLACDFDLKSNYFAWQAFARRYERAPHACVPPYLDAEHYETVRACLDRLAFRQQSMTSFLADAPAESCDCYVLLDAQDWMSDADLTALWTQVTRTARPGARVIFRTAADERLLPGRVPAAILSRWTYDEEACRALSRRDRSSIYGAFHLYTLAARA